MVGSAMVAGLVSVTPANNGSLIGLTTLQNVTNELALIALVACAVAAIVGALRWAFGAGSTNVNEAAAGKKMVVGAVVGAVIIGAAATIINFAYTAGTALK